jgi:hypothetical protein
LTNQKLMIAIAMIALVTAIGSMSIGSMSNNNAFARSSSGSSDDNGNTDDQQGSGSSDSGSGSSHEDQLHQQLKDNGLCPPGHECSCTPASGVFHDHTNGFNINTGCTDNKG